MKKIVLSALAAFTLGSVAANAAALKLYQDENGQVFTQAGEGRTLIKDKSVSVFSHANDLKFPVKHLSGINIQTMQLVLHKTVRILRYAVVIFK
jgi:hypothetical protein